MRPFYRPTVLLCVVFSTLRRILAVCHGVMYKQLAAWMLHGLLLDQSEEFFVKQGPSAGGAAANQEEEEEDLGLGGLSGKQLRELQDLVRSPPPTEDPSSVCFVLSFLFKGLDDVLLCCGCRG